MPFNIPESVQALVDGPQNDRPTCTQCRGSDIENVLLCSRCKVTYYCSQACQKQHFKVHKNACKYTASVRREADTPPVVGQPHLRYRVFTLMADHLVRMGYKESDTIENGRFYYRKALYYLLESMKLEQTDIPGLLQDDEALVLIGILGANEDTIRDWCLESGSERSCYYVLGPDRTKESCTISAEGDASEDVVFQLICMLVAMKRLARYRSDVQASEEFRAVPGNPNHPDQLPLRIQGCIQSISRIDHRILIHLRDAAPFSPEHVPAYLDLGAGIGGSDTPEYWHLLQAAFLSTPGVNDILHEFTSRYFGGR